MNIISGEPLHRGLYARWVFEYSDVGHVDSYISEMMQDMAY